VTEWPRLSPVEAQGHAALGQAPPPASHLTQTTHWQAQLAGTVALPNIRAGHQDSGGPVRNLPRHNEGHEGGGEAGPSAR